MIIFFAIFLGIIAVLLVQSWPDIQHSGLKFFFQQRWDPVNLEFGAAPFLVDTIIVAGIAMLLAGTVGLAAAVYLVEYAPRWLRRTCGFRN